MSISLKKAIVNTVWEFLPEEKRYQLLLNEIEISNLDELSEKFISLGGIYKALSNMTNCFARSITRNWKDILISPKKVI